MSRVRPFSRRLSLCAPLLLTPLAATLVGPAAVAHAQSTAAILGVVADEARAPLPGAVVTLTDLSTGQIVRTTTSVGGGYRFASLNAANRYTLSVEATGFRDSRAEQIDLRAGGQTTVNFVLPSTTTAAVEVTAERQPTVHRTDPTVSGSLEREVIESAPTQGRDLNGLLYLLPGVTPATAFFAETPPVSVNGANSLYTSYLIDGFDNNDQFLGGQKFPVPVGLVQSVEVLSTVYPLEFGNTSAGIVNVTTPSGTNELHATAFLVGRPGPSVDATSPFTDRDLTGNPVRDGFSRHSAGFTLAGPIRQNKTFFFTDIEATDETFNRTVNSPALAIRRGTTSNNRYGLFTGKLDQIWSERQRSALRLSVGRVRLERSAGTLADASRPEALDVTMPSGGSYEDRNAIQSGFSHTVSLGARTVNETRLGYGQFNWYYFRPIDGPAPTISVSGTPTGTTRTALATIGATDYFDEMQRTIQGANITSFALGRHQLRAGVDLISTGHELRNGTFGNRAGSFAITLDSAQTAQLRTRAGGGFVTTDDVRAVFGNGAVDQYSVLVGNNIVGGRQTLVGAFVEDAWQARPDVTVTLGLRYSVDNLSKGASDGYDLNNLGPRVGASWQLSERDVLRGGYGVYYDKVLYGIVSDAKFNSSTSAAFRAQLLALQAQGGLPAGVDIDRLVFNGTTNATATMVDGQPITLNRAPTAADLAGRIEQLPARELRILNPVGYANPFSHQVTLGYGRQLTDTWALSLDGLFAHSEQLPRLLDLNAPTSYDAGATGKARSAAEANATRPVGTPTGGATRITVTSMSGTSDYGAVTLQLKRRLANRWAATGLYTLSRLKNSTDDINFSPSDSRDPDADYGYSLNDRRHVLKGVALYRTPYRVDITLTANVQSGQPFNVVPGPSFGSVDLNGDGVGYGATYVGNSDRYPGEDRNSGRLPWSQTVDLSLGVTPFKLKQSGASLSVRLDVFNLFNTVNYSGYANAATNANQLQVGPGRTFDSARALHAGPTRQLQFQTMIQF